MKTVQVSRRGANKRTLIAGIALGAVVALSYVESAMAAWASCTGANGAELNTVNNPDTTGSTDACKCVEGYAEAVSTDSPTYVGGTTLNCKFCAEGYYLSSIGGEPADHVCSQVSDKVHTGPPTLDLTTYVSLHKLQPAARTMIAQPTTTVWPLDLTVPAVMRVPSAVLRTLAPATSLIVLRIVLTLRSLLTDQLVTATAPPATTAPPMARQPTVPAVMRVQPPPPQPLVRAQTLSAI